MTQYKQNDYIIKGKQITTSGDKDKQTSRHRVLDAVALIEDQIAAASHYQELLNSTDVTDEDKEMYERNLMESIAIRRDTMSKLKSEDGNADLWCILKHQLGSHMYATELYYANPEDPFFAKLQARVSDLMYETLSAFLGMEIVKCGRCLNDELLESQ